MIARVSILITIVVASIGLTTSPTSAVDCAADATAESLDAFFSADDAAGLAGGDGSHIYDLQDGRFLWLFQDNYRSDGDQLTLDGFAHNRALVQAGSCFTLLDSPGGPGTSWIGSWTETIWGEWFWPLDAEVSADNHLYVFLAYMRDPKDGKGARPVETWRAKYRLPDLKFVDLKPAAEPSSALFGYSIVSDDTWSYLYGNCHRHFLETTSLGFDPSCSQHAYLARVPRGQLDDVPEFWTGTGWSPHQSDRQPVLTGENSMPVSVERFGDIYVAAADEGDWYGSDVTIRTASRPEGPWTEVLRYAPATKCGEACNNYAAFVLPKLQGDKVVVALSNNAWDWESAIAQPSLYRIGLQALDVPGIDAAVAARPAMAPAATGSDDQLRAAPGEDEVVGQLTTTDNAALTVSIDQQHPLFAAARTTILGLFVLATARASLGFASALRRSSRQRRRDALARLRTTGAVRRHHHRPMPGRHRSSGRGLDDGRLNGRDMVAARRR